MAKNTKQTKTVFELKNITKTFLGGKIVANNNVSISFQEANVHALVGENGSGKSTLMNILFGLYKQDSGKILFDGKEVNMYSSGAIYKHKIGMVHQHFHLVDEFSVLDNILVGQESPEVKPEVIKPIISKLKTLTKKQEKLSIDLTKEETNKINEALTYNNKVKNSEKKIVHYNDSIREFDRMLKRDFTESKIQKILDKKTKTKQRKSDEVIVHNLLKGSLKEVLKTSKRIVDVFKVISKINDLNEELISNKITTFGFINKSRALKRFELISKKYNLHVNPKAKVKHLSIGERQMVEIMKVLWERKNVIVFDEPTATLSVLEIDKLLKIIKSLKTDGITIAFISHKLKEVKEIADTISILRKGVLVGTYENTKSLTIQKISIGMVGKNVQLKFPARRINSKPILTVNDLSFSTKAGFKAVTDISFEVKKGEIFGLAGIEGNGQEEVFNMIAGMLKPHNGKIVFNNEVWADLGGSKKINVPLSIRADKYSHSPIDRFKHGIVPEKSLRYNSVLSSFETAYISKWYLNNPFKTTIDVKTEIIRQKREIKFLKDRRKDIEGREYKTLNQAIRKSEFKLARLQEKYPGLNMVINLKSTEEITNKIIKTLKVDGAYENTIPIKNLSGGNQQKFVFSRELLKDHELLLAGHPTRGLDIVSIYNIYSKMREVAIKEQKTTLLYSLEINELMAAADRMAIFYKGKIMDIVNPRTTSIEKISKLMIGVKK